MFMHQSTMPLPQKGEEVPLPGIKEICEPFGLQELYAKIANISPRLGRKANQALTPAWVGGTDKGTQPSQGSHLGFPEGRPFSEFQTGCAPWLIYIHF
jgi:hypothetical protein